MKSGGLVSIICICFNHESWILECLESVRSQDYPQKELIIIDNGSSDDSHQVIQKWLSENSGCIKVEFISYKEPQPYLKVFNDSLKKTRSQYVVDLAGDDLFYPDHLSLSIDLLKRSKSTAFVFSDAYILDEERVVKTFYKRNSGGELLDEIELGKIYERLVQSYIICSPTIVFNRDILVREGGYDEDLFYEDFDIQIRLARKYPLVFSDHIGVLKRKHSDSFSSKQYIPYSSKMLPSTLTVCQKIKKMNENEAENKALGKRILFELKHALWSANFEVAKGFVDLGKEINLKNPLFEIYKVWLRSKIDISWLYLRLT